MKKYKRAISFIIAILVAVSCFSVKSEAAGKTVNTTITDRSSEENIMKKAPVVKTGNNTVQMKKKRTSYIRFTAPKGKYYKFTFTPEFTKKQNKDFMFGYFQISRVKYDVLSTQELPTNGGTYIALNVANKKYINAVPPADDKSQRYRTKRATTIWLDKGETIYISSYFQKNTTPTNIKYKLLIQ